ncbi:MAG: hypothetical protein E7458_10200, partial [Ruminococcaceae bacterium]|nr:hypothetical protein [Oscillospiraceae bacterium]
MTDKKIKRLTEPGYDVFFLVMLVFSVVGFFFHGILVGVLETVAVFVLWCLYRRSSSRKHRELLHYMESITMEINSAGSLAVADFPMPLAVVQVDDGEIIWGNEPFNSLMIKFSNIDDLRITEALDDFSLDYLHAPAT